VYAHCRSLAQAKYGSSVSAAFAPPPTPEATLKTLVPPQQAVNSVSGAEGAFGDQHGLFSSSEEEEEEEEEEEGEEGDGDDRRGKSSERGACVCERVQASEQAQLQESGCMAGGDEVQGVGVGVDVALQQVQKEQQQQNQEQQQQNQVQQQSTLLPQQPLGQVDEVLPQQPLRQVDEGGQKRGDLALGESCQEELGGQGEVVQEEGEREKPQIQQQLISSPAGDDATAECCLEDATCRHISRDSQGSREGVGEGSEGSEGPQQHGSPERSGEERAEEGIEEELGQAEELLIGSEDVQGSGGETKEDEDYVRGLEAGSPGRKIE